MTTLATTPLNEIEAETEIVWLEPHESFPFLYEYRGVNTSTKGTGNLFGGPNQPSMRIVAYANTTEAAHTGSHTQGGQPLYKRRFWFASKTDCSGSGCTITPHRLPPITKSDLRLVSPVTIEPRLHSGDAGLTRDEWENERLSYAEFIKKTRGSK